MRFTIFFCLVFLGINSLKATTDTTKVLFVGNSITYYNDMPQTFEAIANSLNDTTKVTMYAPGGTGFENHVASETLYGLFRQGNWDHIVLQPGTGDSGGEEFGGTPIETTLVRIRTLLDSIYFYNPCAKVIFYEISNGVYGNSASNLETYNNSMAIIYSNTDYFSDSTFLPIAPVGEVFKTQWNNNLDNLLWVSTGNIHPNAKGSYIAACTIYSSIFKKASEGSNIYSSLTPEEAGHFQHLSDSIVLNHLSMWNNTVFDQKTDFEYATINDTIFFNNLSENIDSVIWSFDDGLSSSDINPYHFYENSGNYNVLLTTFNHGCEQSFSKTISFTATNIINADVFQSIFIFPNPTNEFLNISVDNNKNNYRFEVYRIDGKLCIETNQTKINISSLSKGMYFLRIRSLKNKKTKSIKWIKN